MKVGTEDRKKLLLLCVLGVAALGAGFYLYEELFAAPDTSAAVAAPPAVVTQAPANGQVVPVGTQGTKRAGGTRAASAEAQLDPTLKMGAMLVTESLVYTGSGRNIFSGTAAPVAIPKPIAPVRTKVAVVAPVYQAPAGPPPPPPIDLKFFGTATSGAGVRQAFLLRGENVFLASAGDVVQRRYKVVTVSANSIVVEDLVNSNRQTLPLLAN